MKYIKSPYKLIIIKKIWPWSQYRFRPEDFSCANSTKKTHYFPHSSNSAPLETSCIRPWSKNILQVKKWEEDDFYASDEDEFLDRTGTIAKKRHSRMKQAGKAEEVVETYESLMKKHKECEEELTKCNAELKEALSRKEKADARSKNLDLDNYLAELKKGAQVDKETIQKLKTKIFTLNQELERLTKLINIARPASLPELKRPSVNTEKPKLSGIMIGKRGSKGLLGKVKSVSKDLKNPAICQGTDTKVLEAFLNDTDDSKPKRSRLEIDDDSDDEIQPIGYEAKKEPKVTRNRIGDTSVNKPARRMLGPEIPVELRKDQVEDKDTESTEQPPSEKENLQPSEEDPSVAARLQPQAGVYILFQKITFFPNTLFSKMIIFSQHPFFPK